MALASAISEAAAAPQRPASNSGEEERDSGSPPSDSSSSQRRSEACKPPQKAFPHPVTSATRVSAHAGMCHATDALRSRRTAPAAPHLTTTVSLPPSQPAFAFSRTARLSARSTIASLTLPLVITIESSSKPSTPTSSPYMLAASARFGENKSGMPSIARMRDTSISRPALVNDSTVRRPPESLASSSITRRSMRCSRLQNSGLMPMWTPRAHWNCFGSEFTDGRRSRKSVWSSGVRHTCVRRPSSSHTCQARGVCASSTRMSPLVLMSAFSNHSRAEAGKSSPTPAAIPSAMSSDRRRAPQRVCAPPPPSAPITVDPSGNTMSSTMTVNARRSKPKPSCLMRRRSSSGVFARRARWSIPSYFLRILCIYSADASNRSCKASSSKPSLFCARRLFVPCVPRRYLSTPGAGKRERASGSVKPHL
mmetsp:Transcript_30891/g.100558  ORF Transcript_30891/g.100558 Transcript_30891/m.100558 type:complete len:423 (-) Transcript_30891:7-1275(-)